VIDHYSTSGALLQSLGTGGSGELQFGEPWGVALDTSGDLWVAEETNNRLQEINSSGKFVRFVDGLSQPEGVAIDPLGDIWASSAKNSLIDEYTANGQFITSFGGAGTGKGQFEYPCGVAINSSGDLWVVDESNNRVEEFSIPVPEPGSMVLISAAILGLATWRVRPRQIHI